MATAHLGPAIPAICCVCGTEDAQFVYGFYYACSTHYWDMVEDLLTPDTWSVVGNEE